MFYEEGVDMSRCSGREPVEADDTGERAEPGSQECGKKWDPEHRQWEWHWASLRPKRINILSSPQLEWTG